MSNKLHPSVIAELKAEFTAHQHGNRTQWIADHAARLQMHPSTLYGYLQLKKKTVKRAPKISRRDDLVDLIAKMKYESAELGKADRSRAYVDTKFCIAQLIQMDVIKGKVEVDEFGEETILESEISVSYADACLRAKGFNSERRSYQRREVPFVNHTHQVDYSPSKYFGLPKALPNGDWEIQLNRSGFAYDGKPDADARRVRLWRVEYIDSRSRARKVQYVVTAGENIVSMVQALHYFWLGEDSHPMNYLPAYLKMDQGPLSKSVMFKVGLDNLGIQLITAAPKNKRANHEQSQGMIENRFRSAWRREQEFVYKNIRQQKTVLLSDLNHMMQRLCIGLLNKKHPMQPDVKIGQFYLSGLAQTDQRKCTVNLNSNFFRENTRTADPSGVIWIDKYPYTVPERYCRSKVIVFYDVDGRMRGENMDRTDRFDVLPYDMDNQPGSRTHIPSYREEIMKRDDLVIDFSKARPVTPADTETPGTLLTLPPKVTSVEPVTPFSVPIDQPFTSLNAAKIALLEATGYEYYSQIPESIRKVFERIAERDQHELTQGLIDDLAKAVI